MAFDVGGSTLLKEPKVVDWRVDRPYDEDTGEYSEGPTITVHTVAKFLEGDHHFTYIITILNPDTWNGNAVAAAEISHLRLIASDAPADPLGIIPTPLPAIPVVQ